MAAPSAIELGDVMLGTRERRPPAADTLLPTDVASRTGEGRAGRPSPPVVTLVHDYLVDAGGAERVVAAFAELFPDALLYTSLFDARTTDPRIPADRVRTSFIQPFYPGKEYYQALLGLFPEAFRRMRPGGDVVLSSSSAFAKGIRVPPGAAHICYCYTPARFAWRTAGYAEQQGWNGIMRSGLRAAAPLLRRWDRHAAGNVDFFVAMSPGGAERIQQAYGRAAAVIPPPVDTRRFVPALRQSADSYFLTASRLIAYKRIDLAIAACNQLGLPLRVAGAGPDLPRLRALAGPTVTFLGRVPDAELAALYADCTALIQPGEEDFGLTPLEANAAGRPVIAYGAGGALDSVRDGITGTLFPRQTVEALALALAQFRPEQFDPAQLRAHALGYSSDLFKQRIARFVDFAWRHGPRPAGDEFWLAEWQALNAVVMQGVQSDCPAGQTPVPLPPA